MLTNVFIFKLYVAFNMERGLYNKHLYTGDPSDLSRYAREKIRKYSETECMEHDNQMETDEQV